MSKEYEMWCNLIGARRIVHCALPLIEDEVLRDDLVRAEKVLDHAMAMLEGADGK